MHTATLNAAHAERARDATRTGSDRCPTTNTPHRASDGQILRLRLPGGRISPPAALALAAAATPGETIELTSRGNLQLRGLDAAARDAAAQAIADHQLAPSPAHERARTILASPLLGRRENAGLTDALVDALDDAIRARPDTTALSGRVLTVIDDGTGHAWSDGADLLLRWDATTQEVELRLAGRRTTTVPLAEAPRAAARLLGHLATAATAHGVWLAEELPEAALRALGAEPAAPLPAAPALPIGLINQRDGRTAVRVIAPLGRLTPAMLAGAAQVAAARHTELRLDHARGLTLVDLPPAAAPVVLDELTALDLLASATDPAIGLTGCAGRDCTRTEVDVRAALVERRTARRPGAPREHLVGCERRCGAPRDGHTIIAAPTDSPQQLAARAAATVADRTVEA